MNNQDAESLRDANRFDALKPGGLNREEKESVINLALSVLAERHRAGRALGSPEQTRSFLRLKLFDRKHEVFGALFLDNRHRVIQVVEMFQGTIDGASVHPRVVVQRAPELNAAAVVFFHNHPSGVAEPSHADEAITRRLRDALALVDVRVLDHFVVAAGESVSFAERGLLCAHLSSPIDLPGRRPFPAGKRCVSGAATPMRTTMSNQPSGHPLFGEVISVYTRAQALTKGVLIDAGPVAREAGFRWPTAITAGARADCVAWDDADSERQTHQDQPGRLWDVLFMAAYAARATANAGSELLFELYRVPRDGRATEAEVTTLRFVVGPGDDGAPVMTILLPNED